VAYRLELKVGEISVPGGPEGEGFDDELD